MREQKLFDGAVARLGDEADALLKAAVYRVFKRCKRCRLFIAAMGMVVFYGPDGMPFDSERDLPLCAIPVVELGWNMTDILGSPGVEWENPYPLEVRHGTART
ncbi:MAG: hypothetical protein KKA55_06275 [Proteobacteria bacterium]|nr:hypothetical protein [Pseudomonadota bacterium]MBU1595127.1 hypothetical protein [Pseudomonadota bacterium]